MEETILYGVNVGKLALVCLYDNLGLTVKSFPTTDRSNPSLDVVVSLTARGPLWEGDWKQFPCAVRWNIWQDICVPVLQDDSVMVRTLTGNLRNALNASLLGEVYPATLLRKIESALIARFQERGIFPVPASGFEGIVPSNLTGIGEPVARGTSDDVRWAEGNLKLTYPKENLP